MKGISLEAIRECLSRLNFKATVEVLDLEIVSKQDPYYCDKLGLSTGYLNNMMAQRQINIADNKNLSKLLKKRKERKKRAYDKKPKGRTKVKAEENNANTIGLYNLIDLQEFENDDNRDSVQLKKAEINMDDDFDDQPISYKREKLIPPSDFKFTGMHNLMAVDNLKKVKVEEPVGNVDSEIGEMDSFDEEDAIKRLPFIPYYANECKITSDREVQGI